MLNQRSNRSSVHLMRFEAFNRESRVIFMRNASLWFAVIGMATYHYMM